MSSSLQDSHPILPEATPGDSTAEAPERDSVERDEPRNLFFIALYQVVVRTGWIFKTESVVIPAFLDAIGGGHVMRGFLPVLSKFGLSVPPVLASGRLKQSRQKKWVLLISTLAMAVPFLILSGLWRWGNWQAADGSAHTWLPWLFLLLYGAFFAATGICQLTSNTLQGKLIRAERRGRLLAGSMVVGTGTAVFAAYNLLGGWLALPGASGFGNIFGFCGMAFLLGAACSLLLSEPIDRYEDDVPGAWNRFAAAGHIIRDDADFRRLALVTVALGVVFMLFPHYQAMGRERLAIQPTGLLTWVIVQNIAVGSFSFIAGPLADRLGNRFVLRCAMWGCVAAPLVATALCWTSPAVGGSLFWIVFVTLGLTPVTIRILVNYTLEISAPADHPSYVSTLGLCLAAPILVGSPLVGLLIQLAGYECTFLLAALLIAAGGVYSSRLREPRRRAAAAYVEPASDSIFDLED